MKARSLLDCAPLTGNREVESLISKISVRFANDEPLCFQINHLMKTSSPQNKSSLIHPALFQIAARIETTNLARASKTVAEELQKVNAIPGWDADKLNLGERNTNVQHKPKA